MIGAIIGIPIPLLNMVEALARRRGISVAELTSEALEAYMGDLEVQCDD